MKAIKNRIWIVAIALIATTFGACTSDKSDVDEAVKKKVYTLTTTLSQQDPATTRLMLTEDSSSEDPKIHVEWSVNDELEVCYESEEDTEGQMNGNGYATVVGVNDGVATIEANLSNPKDKGKIQFTYPKSTDANIREDQNGSLSDIQQYAIMSGDGTMNVSDNGTVTIVGDGVEMKKYTSIWKFSFTDGKNNITSDITTLKLDLRDKNKNIETYEVTPNSQDEIYVAIKETFPFTLTHIEITATTDKGTFVMSQDANSTLEAGNYYISQGVVLTDYFDGIEVGDYIYADGKWGTSPESNVIAIVFSTNPTERDKSAGYTHGYAMSVKNADGGTYLLDTQDSEINIIGVNGWKYNRDGLSATEEYLDLGPGRGPAANAAHNFGSKPAAMYSDWFLPAIGQWYDICVNLAGRSEANDNGIYYYQYSGQSGAAATALNTVLSNSGASSVTTFTNNPTTCYMTSSRETESIVIHCTFSNSGILHLEHNGNNKGYVRPAIAF